MGGEAKWGASGARAQVNAGVANTGAAGGANGPRPRASGGAAVFFLVIAGRPPSTWCGRGEREIDDVTDV